MRKLETDRKNCCRRIWLPNEIKKKKYRLAEVSKETTIDTVILPVCIGVEERRAGKLKTVYLDHWNWKLYNWLFLEIIADI